MKSITISVSAKQGIIKAALNTMQIIAFIFLMIAFSCQKELSLENHIATGTLKEASGICFPQILHGTFYNGVTPGEDTAYVEVKVNVFTAGSYSIFTDAQNGLMFADSGVFKTAGINIIKLKPGGTPIAPVATDFTIRFDTSVCSLTINVNDSTALNQNEASDTMPLSNWKFTDTKRGITYKGIFENNYILTLGNLNVLVLSTKNAQAPGDSTFMMNIGLPTGSITTGTYTTDDPPTGIVFKTFNDACVNCAGGGLIPRSSGATVTIIITSYDPGTKIVEGHFSGSTLDLFNEIAEIKDGQFSAVVK
ncbi:MAG: hypothetical protein H0V14_00740 [Chitinophagaceae bacterium]|nr:hypothetical protein [Chitinophagaceae bacterium]